MELNKHEARTTGLTERKVQISETERRRVISSGRAGSWRVLEAEMLVHLGVRRGASVCK